MEKLRVKDTEHYVKAQILLGILYVEANRKDFLPKYAYYLCKAHECKGICFKNSSKIYHIEDLKDKETWTNAKNR